MGTQAVKFQVIGIVSRHNSKQDEIDNALWKELHDRVEEIVREQKYQGIYADIV